MICDFRHTSNRLSFGYVRLPQPEYYFSSFSSYFFFFFSSPAIYFNPLNALYSKFERLKITGRTSAEMKSGVPGWGDPPQLGPPKF